MIILVCLFHSIAFTTSEMCTCMFTHLDIPNTPMGHTNAASLENRAHFIGTIGDTCFKTDLKCGMTNQSSSQILIEYCKFNYLNTVFVPITALAPISAHPSYFEVINHNIINCLPRSIHWAYIPSSIWLGICLKMAKIIHFKDIETNSAHPEWFI